MAELQLTKAGPLAAATSATRSSTASGEDAAAGDFPNLLDQQAASASPGGGPKRSAEADDARPDPERAAELVELVPLEGAEPVMDAVPGWPPAMGLADDVAGAVPGSGPAAGVTVADEGALVATPVVATIPAAVVDRLLTPVAVGAPPRTTNTTGSAVNLGPAVGLPDTAASLTGGVDKVGAALAARVPVPTQLPAPAGEQLPAPTVAAVATEGFKPVPPAHSAAAAAQPVIPNLDTVAGADTRPLGGDSLAALTDAPGRVGLLAAAPVSASAPGASAVPGGPVVNAQSPQWLNQTAQILVHQAGAGATRARLVMHPAELGTVQVDLQLGADRRVDIVMTADTPAARDLMEQNAHQLRERLAEQGMTAGQLDVGVRQQPSDAGAGEQPSTANDDDVDEAGDAPEGTDAHDSAGSRAGLLDAYA